MFATAQLLTDGGDVKQVLRWPSGLREVIKNPCFRLTARAVGGVSLCMPETHDHSFERPVLPPRIHPHRHGSTGPQSSEEQVVGDGPVPVPPEAKGSSAHR
jgi:hypothetical protein